MHYENSRFLKIFLVANIQIWKLQLQESQFCELNLATLGVRKASLIRLRFLICVAEINKSSFKEKQILMRNGLIWGAFLEDVGFELGKRRDGEEKRVEPIEAEKKE